MKRIVLVVAVALLLGACIPSNLVPTPQPQPNVDVAGTANAQLQTAVAQTLTSQPTPTLAPVTDTLVPTISPEASPTETPTGVPSPDLTTTPATATGISVTTTTPVSGAVTLIPTLTIRLYGTLPPEVPFGSLRLINKAKTEAYISLQVTTKQGGPTILEYPVSGIETIKAPSGYYLYVAWVGGNKMVGNFSLREGDSLHLTLYKDKVVISTSASYP